jgi:hypothetical protein
MCLSLFTTIICYTIRSQVAVPAHTAHVAAYFMYCATRIWSLAGLYSCRATPERVAAKVLVRCLLTMSAIDLCLHFAKLTYIIGDATMIPAWLSNLNTLLYVPYSVAFSWYLIRLANSLGDVTLLLMARVAFIANAAESGADVVFLVYRWIEVPPPGAVVAGIARLFFFVVSIGVTALFIHLIGQLRKSLLLRLETTAINGDDPSFADPRPQGVGTGGEETLPRVAIGLAVSCLGVVVILLAVAAPTIRWISPEFRWTRGSVSAAAEVMVMIGVALKLFGTLLCINVPEEAKARLAAQIAAGSAALCLFLKTSAYFAALGVLRPLEFNVDLPGALLDLIWSVSFLVYLQRMVVFLGRLDLTRWVKPLIATLVALSLLHPALAIPFLSFFPLWKLGIGYPIAIAMQLTLFYGGLAAFIAYVHFIRLVRRAVLRRH